MTPVGHAKDRLLHLRLGTHLMLLPHCQDWPDKMLRQSGGVDKPQTMFRLRRNAVPADEKEAHLMRTLVLCIKGGPVEAELLERASFTCLLPAAGSSQ